MDMQVTLENKEIRGITLKLFWGIISSVILIVSSTIWTYADLKSSSKLGNLLTMQNITEISNLKTDMKDDVREKNIRLTAIELGQRQLDIRLTILETKLGIETPFKK